MRTNFKLRIRENMPSLLCDEDRIIGTIKDPRYENLLREAGRLREQLDVAVFLLDELPDIDVDTVSMHQVLEDSKIGDV